MPVKVKLDEDLSPMVGEPLRQAGYAVASVLEQGWGGLKDPQLWPHIVSDGVYFVTADKGFGDVRVFAPGTHPGILVLRAERESLLDFRLLVARVLEKYRLESLVGCITVATKSAIRVRRNPPGGPRA